jgi:hypothetical protein
MKHSTFRSTPHPLLFAGADDFDFRCMAQTRNHVGEFFEAATAAVINGRRLKTDGEVDICPDVQIAPGIFAESKGVGQSGAAIIYECRIEKEMKFAREHAARYFYFFWHHATQAAQEPSLYALRSSLAHSVRSLTILDLETVWSMTRDKAPRMMNPAYSATHRVAYGSYKYGTGWSIPIKRLRSVGGLVMMHQCTSLVYENILRPFPVFGRTAEFEAWQRNGSRV